MVKGSSDKAKALKAFQEKLSRFSGAAQELLDGWDRLVRTLDDPNDLSHPVENGYPFHKDFMELQIEIAGWARDVNDIKVR